MTCQAKGLIHHIKKNRLTLGDFLLMFGFLFSIPFYAFAWKFMVTWDPSQIFFDTRMIITCFAITIICWAIYFVLEIKKGRIKFRLFTIVYIFMAIMSVVAVLIQKNVNTFFVECKRYGSYTELYYPGTRVGDIVEVTSKLTSVHKLFFACASFVITTIFYIVLCVLPKRIKSMNFLIVIAMITIIFMTFVCIYSYIVESDKYIPFIKAFFAGDLKNLKDHAMEAFLTSSVPYGVCMMLAFLFAILAHSITKKNYWFIPAIFFLINMLFSYCRTSIAISYSLMILYLIFKLITSFKRHVVRNSILTSILFSIIVVSVVLSIISLVTKGSFIPFIYNHIKSFTNSDSLETRKYIWINIRSELKHGWIIIGRGFGTHNYMLYPMNLVNDDNLCPSHSTYYAILGAGGIISMVGFIGLITYYVICFIKSFKFSKTMPILLSTGLIGFLTYSYTEGVNYLAVVFTFPLILYFHIQLRKSI